jgi:multicomponent Na+:H+ antiporter subunit E
VSRRHLRVAPLRLVGFTFLWWVLSEGVLTDWPLVLLFALLATASSLLLLPPGSFRLRPLGLVRFVPYFLWQSLLGGLDVARRALSPALPLAPGFIEVPLGLKGEAAQAFFVWTVSLLPGTAGAELLGGSLKVHVLDVGQNNLEKLRALERKVAGLFAEEA